MEVELLTLDREEAARMFRKYREHRHYQKPNPVDQDVLRIYEAIAKGKVVVRALDSIRKAGLGEDRLPRLAIARADERFCYLSTRADGSAQMSGMAWVQHRSARDRVFDFARETFPGVRASTQKAVVPHIPPDIRPRRGIQNYHVLWEAEWRPEPPRDPMLLRRLGKTGDIWLVVGAWDLTDVERAVMANHMAAARRS